MSVTSIFKNRTGIRFIDEDLAENIQHSINSSYLSLVQEKGEGFESLQDHTKIFSLIMKAESDFVSPEVSKLTKSQLAIGASVACFLGVLGQLKFMTLDRWVGVLIMLANSDAKQFIRDVVSSLDLEGLDDNKKQKIASLSREISL